MNKKKEFWLVTTEHLEDRLLFKDAEDFRVGMNYVAVQVHKGHIIILVFILMSNHLHFILYCTYEEAEQFINGLKQEYSGYLRRKYGHKEHLRRNGVDIKLVTNDNESLERAIAYVQMNCVAANICGSPWVYPWCTGSCFFNGQMEGVPESGGAASSGCKPLSSLSARERYRLIHSKAELPGEWLISAEGYILPSSYVCKDLVERAFRSPKRMNYFLQSSSKAKIQLETGEQNRPAFKDQVILSALPDMCWSLFRKQRFDELSEDQLLELMRQVRFRFAANVNQIARVTGMSYEDAAAYLDRI